MFSKAIGTRRCLFVNLKGNILLIARLKNSHSIIAAFGP